MGSEQENNCITEINEDGFHYCGQCKPGYGVGGQCENNKCQSCVKCGQNCDTCRKCICTSCSRGQVNNPRDPSNCIEGEEYSNPGIIDYSEFECNGSLIKLNLLFLLIVILLFKIKIH